MTAVNYMSVLYILFFFGIGYIHGLSVTNYGSLQISMVRHGEKYATNRDFYSLEDIQPKYHGMTHVRGPNDKQGSFLFTVNVPVHVYLAVDSRYTYIHGAMFKKTGDHVVLGGCHKRTPFLIYKSVQVYPAGVVNIAFITSRMTAVFLRDARLIQPDAELQLNFPPNYGAELSMARDGEKFSTNRKCYLMVDIPPSIYGLTHVRLLNDVPSPIIFTTSVPIMVYVAIDSRYPNPFSLASGFKTTGEKIVHGGCHIPTDFPLISKYFDAGQVRIEFATTRMMTVFVKPIIDNTFKSGVY